MKKLIIYLLILSMIFTLNIFGNELSILPETMYIDSLISRILIYNNLGTLLSNYVPQAIFLIEESGSFSRPDLDIFSIYGSPWIWNNYYINNHKFNDIIFTGTKSFNMPLLILDGFGFIENESNNNFKKTGLSYMLNKFDNSKSFQYGGYTTINLFPNIYDNSFFPHYLEKFYVKYINLGFLGTHAVERTDPAVESRRQTLSNTYMYMIANYERNNFNINNFLDFGFGERQFVNFDINGEEESVSKGYFVNTNFLLYFDDLFAKYETLLTLSYNYRDMFLRELGFNKEESSRLNSFNILIGLNSPKSTFTFSYKFYSLIHNDIEFTKELIDPDGEAYFPYYPDGVFNTFKFDYTFHNSNIFINSNNNIIFFRPEIQNWTNQLTYEGAAYGNIEWESENNSNIISNNEVGYKNSFKKNNISIDYNFYFSFDTAINNKFTNSLFLPNLGLTLNMNFLETKPFSFFINFGITPIDINYEIVKIINPDYFNGIQYRAGNTVVNYGGKYISIDKNLQQPQEYGINIGFEYKINSKWSLNFNSNFKYYHNLMWIDFDGQASEYGHYDSEGVFYFDENNGDVNYILTNYKFEKALPFTTGAHIQFLGQEDDKWYFSFYFGAIMGKAINGFGNGVYSNEIGLLDWSQANPNTTIYGYGRTDSDKGYVANIAYGVSIIDNLWLQLNLAYRDGQPFAKFSKNVDGSGQVAFVYTSLQGNSPDNMSGPREDCVWYGDISLSYTIKKDTFDLRFNLIYTNFIDFGYEMNESVFEGGRSALDLQIPGTIMFLTEFSY